jgi:hypothetical protein
MKLRSKVVLATLSAVALAACARTAANVPPRSAARTPSQRLPAAVLADTVFWRTLHAGAYDSIPRALMMLKAAYLQNPADATTAAHVAFLHTWRIAERARLTQQLPSITDDATLAVRYFELANKRMANYDARTHGFAAVMKMVEGRVHGDTSFTNEGLAQGRRSIDAWPEFNLFTIGYTLSTHPDTSALFREAVAMQWRTLDLCRRKATSRTDPEPGPMLGQGLDEPDLKKRRACFNSWIAPHNIEGYFLNMGDMVMRTGDVNTAVKVYALARQSEDYASWPYREVLEARIRDASAKASEFRGENPRMMLNSRFACAACHQAK